jgi:hypothetical protein
MSFEAVWGFDPDKVIQAAGFAAVRDRNGQIHL